MALFDSWETRLNYEKTEVTFDYKSVVLSVKVMEIQSFLDYIQSYSSFTRHQKMRKRKVLAQDERVYSVRRSASAGSDTYVCQYAAKPIDVVDPVSKKVSKLRSCCKAKLVICFPEGYEHTKKGEINVAEFGQKSVILTWNWKHNHDEKDFAYFGKCPMTKRMKKTLELLISSGMGSKKIDEMIKKETLRWNDKMPSELLKVKEYHIYNLRRKDLWNKAIKDATIPLSLQLIANDVNQSIGMAEFRDESSYLEEYPLIKFERTSKFEIWSFVIMSEWQKSNLVRDGKIFYLDATLNTCYGYGRSDKVNLFTIVVESRVTGQGCPVAFMLTNSQHHHVIEYFLRKVKTYSGFFPERAVIDCDTSEMLALKNVLPQTRVVLCRWHVQKAFRKNLITLVKLDDPSSQTAMHKRITDEFDRILSSSTIAEGELRMNSFLETYKDLSSFVSYVKTQWASKLKHITAVEDVPSAMTNNYVESFHSKFKRFSLSGERKQRPDVLIHKLMEDLMPTYIQTRSTVKQGTGQEVIIRQSEQPLAKQMKSQMQRC